MTNSRATADEFFNRLAKLIDDTQQKGHGSVFLTQKRLDNTSSTHNYLDTAEATALPILLRVSDGDTQSVKRVKNRSHVKFSTIVQPDDLEAFFTRYAEVCKTGMQSLKKRDRSKRKKDKSKKKKAVEAKS